MAISKEKKQQMVADYVERLSNSQAVIFTDYRGLDVAALTNLRRLLREEQSSYQIIKNTLFQLALEQAELPVPAEYLDGPVAVSYCFEEVPPVAKALVEFGDRAKVLKIRGALLGDSLLNVESVKDLADLLAASGLLPEIASERAGEPGQGDCKVQAYNFRMCLTNVPENRVPFTQPAGYDAKQYELLVRVFESDAVPHPLLSVDPARDIEQLELELTLADLGVVEKRLERLKNSGRSGTAAEKEEAKKGYTFSTSGMELPEIRYEMADTDPIITGIRWVSELVELAGGRECFPDNAVQALGKNRIVADPREVVQRSPDIIIGSWCGKKFRPERVAGRDGWSEIPAVRRGDIYEIKSALILQPGPAALTDGLDQLRNIISRWEARR
mgnify:CR=1 FL=1